MAGAAMISRVNLPGTPMLSSREICESYTTLLTLPLLIPVIAPAKSTCWVYIIGAVMRQLEMLPVERLLDVIPPT